MSQDSKGTASGGSMEHKESIEPKALGEASPGVPESSKGLDRRALVKAAIAATGLRHYAWLVVPVAVAPKSMGSCTAPGIEAPLADAHCGTGDGKGGFYNDLLCNTPAATKEGYDHDDDCNKPTGTAGQVWTDDSCASVSNSTGLTEMDEACAQNTQAGMVADEDCGTLGTATGHFKDNDCNVFGDADNDCNHNVMIGAVHKDQDCGGRGGTVSGDLDCGNGSSPLGQPHTDDDCALVPTGGFASQDNDCSPSVAPDGDCSVKGNATGVHQDNDCPAPGQDGDCGLRNFEGGQHKDGS